eukprot:jgi/Botrbrau1/4574/Bobra.60_2s0060.1
MMYPKVVWQALGKTSAWCHKSTPHSPPCASLFMFSVGVCDESCSPLCHSLPSLSLSPPPPPPAGPAPSLFLCCLSSFISLHASRTLFQLSS